MEKDPRKLNTQVEPDNTYPGQRDPGKIEPLAVDLLPSIFRTETNKKILGAMVEDLFQPAVIENVNFHIGRPSAIVGKQEFLPRSNSRRQLEPGLLIEDSAGTRVLTADDIASAQGYSEDHLAEPTVPVSVQDLPINADKFINWNNYYWVEEGLPTLYITGPAESSDEPSFDVERDILGKKHFRLPVQKNGRCLDLMDGMRLVFDKKRPGFKEITGDTSETHVARGTIEQRRQLDFQHEMTQQYDKRSIVVTVDGVVKESDVHFDYTAGSIIWREEEIPAEGAVIELFMPDFWVTINRDLADLTENGSASQLDRVFMIHGAGSPNGIKLLGLSYQITNTVYSARKPGPWDRGNIAWDRIEWDADFGGINDKHYSLMAPGIESRASHSRINCWVHKDIIQAVANYLDVDVNSDIVAEENRGLRPILEFDSSLELYNHGRRYRHWVDGVVTKNIPNPESLKYVPGVSEGVDVAYMLVATMLGTFNNTLDPIKNTRLFDTITNAIVKDDYSEIDSSIRGLEPKNLIIETIGRAKAVFDSIYRGTSLKTLSYRVGNGTYDDGEVKISRLFVATEDEPITIKGTVTDVSELPLVDNVINDGYVISGQGIWVWNGIEWIKEKIRFNLTANVVGSDGEVNSGILNQVYRDNLDRCYVRIHGYDNKYVLANIIGESETFVVATEDLILLDEPSPITGVPTGSIVPIGQYAKILTLAKGYHQLRYETTEGDIIEGWVRSGFLRDHCRVSCEIVEIDGVLQVIGGFPVAGQEIKLGFAQIDKDPNRTQNLQRRVLWMMDGPYKNKIVTLKATNPYDLLHTIPRVFVVLAETSHDQDVTIVRPFSGALSCQEYYWKGGVAIKAQTRSSKTDVAQFRLYDRNGVPIDEWIKDGTRYTTSKTSTTIIDFSSSGSTVDTESGFAITFLPSQFRMLDSTSSAANAFYDVEFSHVLQDEARYFDPATSESKTIPGPYNFRRLRSSLADRLLWSENPVEEQRLRNEGLSTGYRRAWFRLRSWVINTYDISDFARDDSGKSLLDLPTSVWPTYHWNLTLRQGVLEVQHPDNHERTIENIMIGGIGETVFIDTAGVGDIVVINPYTGEELLQASANDLGEIYLEIPEDFQPGIYDLRVDDAEELIKFVALHPKVDPRAPVVKVDGLPAKYDFSITRTDGEISAVQLRIEASQGQLEINHQGQFTSGVDHATGLPGLEYNPSQDLSFGAFSPSRILPAMMKCIRTNSLDGDQPWYESAKINYLDGVLMADTSSMRGQWAQHRLNPTLSEAIASRSMATWRWYRKFISLLNKYHDNNDLNTETPGYWLDKILEELTVGINYSLPDSVSGMVFSTGSMNWVDYTSDGVDNVYQVNTMGADIYDGVFGSDHIYVYVNGRHWLPDLEYEIGEDRYYFSRNDTILTFFKITDEGSAPGALPADTRIQVYHAAEESVYSGMPASPAKLGLGGVFKPGFLRETWSGYDRFLIQRHDGSRVRAFQAHTYAPADPRDQILLDLEYRIYSACRHRVGDPQRQRLLMAPPPGVPVSAGRAQACLEWFDNNEVDFRARLDYIEDNPWTWNWSGKSWRGIYTELFGTVKPHTHPWEMLGFDEEPAWWSTHYSWVNADKRAALEQALTTGLISEPGQPETYDLAVRRRSALGFPVDSNGVLMDPGAWGLPLPSDVEAQQPWDLGALGTQEEIWLRSPAGVWATALDMLEDPRFTDRFVDTGITPFVEPIRNNSPSPIGLYTQGPSNFIQVRPTIGIGSLLFEANREINLLGESPLLELGLVQVVLQFAMGGFSDNNIRFRMYHTKYQNSNFVPEEDFLLAINPSVAEQQVRYSAVRLQKDGTGFRVFGYDHVNRYFEVATPIKRGPSGSTSGNYQRLVSTPNETLIRYLKWDVTPTKFEYGSYITDKQELFDFFVGLGEFQKSRGMVFDAVNDRGSFDDWEQAALDALEWVSENWSLDTFVVVSPISGSKGFKLYHAEGQLDRMDSDQLRRGKILFFSGRLAQGSDLLVTREIELNTDYIQPLNGELIAFADFKIRKFDHVYFFNSFTRFGDTLFDKKANMRLAYLTMVGRRSRGWNGRIQAQGLIPQEQGLLPGFDALITDIVEARRPEKSQFDTFKGTLSKSNVVPAKNTVLSEIIEDPAVMFQYRQGLQTASGTNLAIDALFRNREFDIPGRTQDLNINEQWLFTDGEFGKLGDRKIWEVLIRRDDVTSKRQAVRFSNVPFLRDSKNDTIIDLLGPRDPRWITRDFRDVDFAMVDRQDITPQVAAKQGWLPSAGVANLRTSDIKVRDVESFLTSAIVNEKMLDLLAVRSFSKFSDYRVGDIVWYPSNGVPALWRCEINVFGGADTAWTETENWSKITADDADSVPISEIVYIEPPTVWVSDYARRSSSGAVLDYGWNYLQMSAPQYVEEVCPNAIETGLNESKVTFANPHSYKEGDIIFLTGSGDGNYDRLHKVAKVVDNYNLLINARSTGDVIVYNMVAFKFIPSKYRSLEELEEEMGVPRLGLVGFVEPDGSPEGAYDVYEYRENSTWALSETLSTTARAMVDSHAIDKVLLIDPNNEEVLATLEVYDPYKGLVIDEVAQYIDYRVSADPAVYNLNDLGLPDLDVVELWGANQLGKIWWDTSEVRYVEYEQSDLKYRIQNWGNQFDGSRVMVYEWTRSTTPPDPVADLDVRLDYSSGVGVVRYSAIDEEDSATGAITTYYYYWKRNIDVLPEGSSRKYSAQDIEVVLDDPDAAGVSWFSPIYGPGSVADPKKQFSAFLVSNIDNYLSSRSEVILRIVQKRDPEQHHVNGILVSEGFTGDAIPEYLYRKMKAGVVGRDQYRKNYELKPWRPDTAYNKGDYVIHWNYSNLRSITDGEYGPRDIPILTALDGDRDSVKQVRTPVIPIYADPREVRDPLYREKLHRVMIVTKDNYVSSYSFAEDFLSEKLAISGADALVKNGMGIPGYRTCQIVDRRVPDPRLNLIRRFGSQYVPVPQTWFRDIVDARLNLTKAANAYLLKINTVNKPNWDQHLRTYKPLAGPYVGQKDISDYWYYVDYATDDYVPGSEQYFIEQGSFDINEIYGDVREGIFAIVDELGVIQSTYLKQGKDLNLLFQKNGTIQIKEDIVINTWDSSRWDQWDIQRRVPAFDKRWDEDNAEVLEGIITALRENIFTGSDQGYFNLLFFDMVKESLRQIPNADWVSKTTYMDIAQESTNDLKETALYFDRRDIQIKQYVNEVKPYHSKVVDINQDFTTYDEFAMAFGERMEMSVIRNVRVLTRDYFTEFPPGTDPEQIDLHNPTRSSLNPGDPEPPVYWTETPLLTTRYEMLEISEPDRKPEYFRFKDPDSPDIEEI